MPPRGREVLQLYEEQVEVDGSEHVPPKRWYFSNRQHDAVPHKTALSVKTAVRTSSLSNNTTQQEIES